MSKMDDMIKQERENLKSKIFSMDSFTKLLTCYVNDPEFESHTMKKKGEEAHKLATHPVKGFRDTIVRVLVDFGVDAKDAEEGMKNYQFRAKDVQSMYDFITDFIYQYLSTGRKLDLFKREDAIASIYLKDEDETVGKHRLAKNPSRKKKHKKLVADSSCPEWQKETLSDDESVVIKAMKIVCGE